jgi:hypothetical protein
MIPFARYRHSPCSLGLSATSQQYFSLTTNQPPATSNQPAVLFSQNKPAPAISHQPTEQAEGKGPILSSSQEIENNNKISNFQHCFRHTYICSTFNFCDLQLHVYSFFQNSILS